MNKAIEEVLDSFKSFLNFTLLLFNKQRLKTEMSIAYFNQNRLELYSKLAYSSIFLLLVFSLSEYINAESILTYDPEITQVNILDHFLSMSFGSLVPAIAVFIIILEIALNLEVKSKRRITFVLSYISIFISYINIIISVVGFALCLLALFVQSFLPFLIGHTVANILFFCILIGCVAFISNRYTIIQKNLRIRLLQINILSFCSFLLFSFLVSNFSEAKPFDKKGKSVSFLTKKYFATFLADSISPNCFKVYSELIFENRNSENLILPQDTIHFNLYVTSYAPGLFSKYRTDTVKFVSINEQKLLSFKRNDPSLIKLKSNLDSSQIRKIIPSYRNYPYHLILDVETLNLGKAEIFKFNIHPRFIEGNNFIADRFCCTSR